MFKQTAWKHHFPIFSNHAQPQLIYLDSAASCLTLKPVAESMYHYQCYAHANSHRGFYQMSSQATQTFEQGRAAIAGYLSVQPNEIVITKNTTDAINLVATAYLEYSLKNTPSKHGRWNVVISAAEHHANILPWQRLCHEYQGELRVAELDENGLLEAAAFETLIDEQTLLVSVTHVSNVLGLFNDILPISQLAKQYQAKVLVDGAQAVSHGPLNLDLLGCDFYAFSGHKMYGPTGVGGLYINASLVDDMSPYQLGGGIVGKVTQQQTNFVDGTDKFHSGTLNISALAGLTEAINFLDEIGWHDINNHQNGLARTLQDCLSTLSFIDLALPALPETQTPWLYAFNINNVHSHDVASILDSEGIAVRAGHHCAQLLYQQLDCHTSVRASVGIHNQVEDIERLADALTLAHNMMAV